MPHVRLFMFGMERLLMLLTFLIQVSSGYIGHIKPNGMIVFSDETPILRQDR